MLPTKNIRIVGAVAFITVVLFSLMSYSPKKAPTNLIILPCHSVYKDEVISNIDPNAGSKSESWILAPFQVEADDHLSFIDHVERCNTLIKKRSDDAVLMLSGGFTKSQLELSESRSYFNLGLQRGWFDESMLNKSIFLEEFARDSYENVLFSLIRFYKLFHKYPKVITVVGFEFKEPRFVELHLKTLGYTGDNVEYIGIGPDFPKQTKFETLDEYTTKKDNYFKDLEESEKEYAYNLFVENPFGSEGSKLHKKKISRDPWNKSNGIPVELKSSSEPLNYLISIDGMEIDEALQTYNAYVLPQLPLV